jgi:light-regulated signal transduction histidine kinase (bacteriophytochrome)
VTIFQDITSRKLAEQSLRQSEEAIRELNQHLEKRVEERTSELLLANKELEAFAYTISHDLRAPVRAISGFTKILEEDYLPQLNAEGQRVFRVIAENTRKMDQLIDDLLSFSRLSRAEMNLSNVNMKDIIMHCFLEQTTPESRQKIGFKVSDFPLIKGDHAMLTQVWTNLISNALKFTSQCSMPLITIDGHQQNNEFVYVISDNGTGFDMHYVDKLFGVFQRLHSVKDYEGTGVGLAIVQRVIIRHGGRIWAEGEVGKGAKFSFTLEPE